jgi:hypothetical protein
MISLLIADNHTILRRGHIGALCEADQSYSGRPMRRAKSAKRRSDLSRSKRGSSFK